MLLLGTVVLAVLVFLLLNLRRVKASRGRRAGHVRPPIEEVLADPSRTRYLCRNLSAPELSGYTFKVFLWLGTRRLLNDIVTRYTTANSGIDILLGEYIPEPPTFNPTPPLPLSSPDPPALISSNDKILKTLVEAALSRDTDGFCYTTVADFYSAYRSGRCTPMDVARGVLKAVADSNSTSPPLRAIVDINEESVMKMAQASSERWRNGKPLSLLDGVPISLKGFICVDPYPTRGGSLFVPTCIQGVPEADATRKLKDMGAIIAGVANMQEFGTGTLGSNCNRLHLTARNPHNPRHYCGGSSSGSGSCVAAGICPVSMGGDGGGSVRIPAGVCGVVGLKPTNNLMNHAGAMTLSPTLGTMGPLSSSVLDTAIAMNTLLRNEQHSFNLSGLQRSFDLQQEGKPPLEGITAGIYWDHVNDADPEILQAFKQAIGWLEDLGVVVEEIVIPEIEEARVAHMISISAEFGNAVGIDIDRHFSELNPETSIILGAGLNFTATDYINAQRQRTRAVKVFEALFKDVHVILTPATACFAPEVTPDALYCGKLDAVHTGRLMRYSFLGNLTGIPGLVLPVGSSRSGLPISLQLLGPWHQEGLLIQVAWALERVTPTIRRPQVHYDLIPK